MAMVGLDHVQIAIPEGGEDKARAFYGQLLGMDEVQKPHNLSPNGCWFERGPLKLHVGIDPDFIPARKAHPALLVDDLGELRSRLEEVGHETKSDKPIAGYARFFCFDPFGNRVEFMRKI